MKNLFIFLLLGIFLISFTSAINQNTTYITAENGGDPKTNNEGPIIVTNQYNITIDNVTLHNTTSATKVYILFANKTTAYTASNISGVANFVNAYLLSNSTYYIVAGSDGATYNERYQNAGATFPLTGALFNITKDYHDNLNSTSVYSNIKFISASNSSTGTTGLFYINLVDPTNATTISDVGYNFSVYASSANNTRFIKNITYFVWNGVGSVHNQTTISGLNSTNISYSQFIDDFIASNYTWNAKVCEADAPGTGGVNCTFAPNNFTLIVAPFSLLSNNYSSSITEGSNGVFSANISFLSGYRMSKISLVYNGTPYSTSFNEYATNRYYVTNTLAIPSVSTNTNVSFYWNVTLETGLSVSTENFNQTIINLAVDNCGTYTNQLFNFTMLDEDTQTNISNSPSIKIDLQFKNPTTGQTIINYSAFYNNTNPIRICSGSSIGNSTFRLDGQVQYSSTGRFTEFYNIQNYSLNTSTTNQNITLYDLSNTGGGLEFKITYKDSNFNSRPGAVIQIKRKYIDEGIFKVVELPKIGSAGYALAHLVPSNEIYSLLIVENGTILDSFDNIIAYCPNPTFTECVITLNSYGSSVNPGSFDTQEDFSSSLTYNKTSRVITAIFTIPSGGVSTVVLNATKADVIGTTVVCNDTLVASGGTLTCTIPPSIGNTTIKVYLSSNGVTKKWFVMSLSQTPQGLFGASLIFYAIVLLLFFIGIGIQQDPKIMGITLILGIIVMSALNVITSGSWIGKGATILWIVVAMVIILIKSENNR